MNDHYDKFRLSDALMSVYKLVWDDFCSWYLELVKPAYEQPIDPRTLNETIAFLEELLKLLHPFTPVHCRRDMGQFGRAHGERPRGHCPMAASGPR